jgi:hypothetical protein
VTVIPFPRVRNRRFVLKHAARLSYLPHVTAEKHLAQQLLVQVDTMRRRGISADLIEAERQALESAIRTELRRLAPSHGGAA